MSFSFALLLLFLAYNPNCTCNHHCDPPTSCSNYAYYDYCNRYCWLPLHIMLVSHPYQIIPKCKDNYLDTVMSAREFNHWIILHNFPNWIEISEFIHNTSIMYMYLPHINKVVIQIIVIFLLWDRDKLLMSMGDQLWSMRWDLDSNLGSLYLMALML